MGQTYKHEKLKEIVRPYYLKWAYFPLTSGRPAHFSACWDYPAVCGAEESVLAPRPEHLPDIVFLPMADWHTRIQRTQHMAATLARMGYRCFYVNPHLGRQFPMAFPHSPRQVLTKIGTRVYELHVHLWREPVFHHRCLEESEQNEIFSALNRVLTEFDSHKQIVISSLPIWNGVAERMRAQRDARIVYDCHDLLEGFGDVAEDILAAENTLLEMSDWVVFSANSLQDHHTARRPAVESKSLLLPNAVDPSHFKPVDKIVRPLQSRKPPCIGYVGSMHHWLDVDAVIHAARQRPDWQFEFVGRQERSIFESLRQLPNVQLTGEVPYRDLPTTMALFDVALIPFKIMPLTLATNPVKLYEYFACGLPVVSSPLPEVLRYVELVEIYRDGQDLINKIELAMREDPVRRQQRVTLADQESWVSRCNRLMSCVTQPAGRSGTLLAARDTL